MRRISLTRFTDFRIRTKLAIGFAAVFGVIAVVAGIGASAVLSVQSSAEDASSKGQRLNALTLELQTQLANAQRDVAEYSLSVRNIGPKASSDIYTVRVANDLNAARALIAEITPLVSKADEPRVTQMTNQIERFDQEFQRLTAAWESYGTADSGHEGTFRKQLRAVEDGLSGKAGVEKALAGTLAVGRAADDYLARPSDAAVTRMNAALAALRVEVESATGLKAEEKASLRTAIDTEMATFQMLTEAQTLVLSSQTNFQSLVQGIGTSAKRIGTSGLDASNAAAKDIQRTSDDAVQTVVLYTVVGALMAALMVVVLTRTITGRIARLVDASNRMSLGELDVTIPVEGKDEVGQLAESLRRMQASLRAAIERLRARRAAA